MTGKAFCVSIMMVMVETWMRKANSYPRICVYSTEHNSVPFSYGKDPVIKLPPGCSKEQFHIRSSMLISTVVRHSAVVLFRSAVLRGSSCS